MSLKETISKIEQHAQLASNEKRNVGDNMKPHQAVRQGDLYLVRVEKDIKGLKKLSGQQLVPGTTQGSRHFASAPAQLFESDNLPIKGVSETALRGPVVKSLTRFDVTHPEHAHISLPAGTYQVLYQLDFQAQRRVAD
jgi:hypothetical protein